MHIQGNLNADSSERALFGSPVNEGGMISMAASGGGDGVARENAKESVAYPRGGDGGEARRLRARLR